jgi:FemAB-related protein (PEP-CTERM system-associated)
MKRDVLDFGSAASSAGIQVSLLRPSESRRWDEFVARCPDATFFHRAGWRTVIEEVFGHKTFFLLAARGGDVLGVLPLAQVRSLLFGHALTSLPFCVYGGTAVTDKRAEQALIDAARALARQLRVQHLELRNRVAKNLDWPRQDLYVTFRKELLSDPEANMLAIPRKQRAMVRKGIKAGLRAEIDNSVERFFGLYADNVHRHGTPALPKEYFRTLCREFAGDCEILTVLTSHGVPTSSVLSFYFRDEVLPYYAGDRPEAREVGANDFKYWEVMRRACERGCRIFDYGRSKRDTGSYAFKRNWGFEPTPLQYEYDLLHRDTVPQNNPSNSKYRAFISCWRRLPLPLANALGPFIVRNLG